MEDNIGAIKGLFGATRKQKRVDVFEPITITTAHHPAKIIDLSKAGMFIETNLKLEKGCEVELYIGKMLFCGVVRQSSVKVIEQDGKKVKIAGLGVKFTTLTPKHHELIQKFIDTHLLEPTISGYDSDAVAFVDPDKKARLIYSDILQRNGIKVFESDEFSDTLLDKIRKSGPSALVCEYTNKTVRAIENIRVYQRKMPIFVLTNSHDVNKLKLEEFRAKYRSKLTTTPQALLDELNKILPIHK
jgi:hypothetical protein